MQRARLARHSPHAAESRDLSLMSYFSGRLTSVFVLVFSPYDACGAVLVSKVESSCEDEQDLLAYLNVLHNATTDNKFKANTQCILAYPSFNLHPSFILFQASH